jgi:microcystin-dependent protein
MATVNLSPLFNGVTNFDSLGNILAGGQLFTYQAGSSTPLATYTTVNGTIANANPIVLGSDGKIPNELWLLYGYAYKFVLQTASSVLVNTYDNISGIITTIPTSAPTLPTGVILIWSGSVGSIPSGYVICDGSNGTPDLRNSFVLGAGNSYTVGQTGGSADSIVVAHNHTVAGTTDSTGISGTFTANSFNSTVGTVSATGVFSAAASNGLHSGGGGASNSYATYSLNAPHTHTFSTTSNSTGTSGTNANLPPYYALAYVMKI